MKWIYPLLIACVNVCSAQIDLDYELVQSGFTQPVSMAHAGDGSNRMFVAERAGIIKIIDDLSTGNTLPTPFLNIASLVQDSGGEQGLLGLAFHPDYATNGYFYVNYIYDPGAGPDRTRIARYEVSSGDPNAANPASALLLLEYDQDFSNHNGGDLHFGPLDGYLYIASGDGGGGNDPNNRAQNKQSYLGKLLRIDVDGDDYPSDPDRNYAIPESNPFAGSSSTYEEIFSLGLRNPWRFSFDCLTADLYIADVGQSAREEINFRKAGETGGENFGWDCREGLISSSGTCNGDPLTDPVFDYVRTQGRSVTGGYVYRGTQYPDMFGTYIFADYAKAGLWALEQNNGVWVDSFYVHSNRNGISCFGEAEDKELYFADLDDGTIYHLIDSETTCDLNLAINPIIDPQYDAVIEITSDATMTNNQSTIFEAGQTIELQPGFFVPLTAEILLAIDECGGIF